MAEVSIDQSKLPGVKEGNQGGPGPGAPLACLPACLQPAGPRLHAAGRDLPPCKDSGRGWGFGGARSAPPLAIATSKQDLGGARRQLGKALPPPPRPFPFPNQTRAQPGSGLLAPWGAFVLKLDSQPQPPTLFIYFSLSLYSSCFSGRLRLS